MMDHRERERKSDEVKKPKASEKTTEMAHTETNGSKLFITGEMISAWLFNL